MSHLNLRPAASIRLQCFNDRRRMACVVRGGVVDLGHVSSPRRPSKQFLNAVTARRERARAQQAATHSGAAAAAASPSVAANSLSHSPGQSSLALLVSQRIAAARAVETRRPIDVNGSPPLFLDPYAELLAGWRHGPVSDSHSAKETGASPKAAAAAAAEVQQQGDDEGGQLQTALDIIATAHVDRLLLNATAVAAVNRITQGDYRQVVLLGDAMDTRPYRLPLAPGTAIFMVAPAEAHAAAAAALASEEAAAIADAVTVATESTAAAAAAATAATEVKRAATTTAAGPDAAASTSGRDAASASAGRGGRSRSRLRGPRPPPGCLLRRVSLELQPGGDFSSLPSALEAAGFLPDRLSVWAVQGLAGLGLSQQDVTSLLAEAAHCAAYHSLLLGELPPLAGGRGAAANALAECGLLGAPLAFGTADSSYGRWRPEWGAGGDSGDGGGGGGAPSVEVAAAAASEQRWLFAAQQIRLSAAQMDTFEAHRAAAEETDEDFFDNFS